MEKLKSGNYKIDAEGFVLGLQKEAEYCGEIKLKENDYCFITLMEQILLIL